MVVSSLVGCGAKENADGGSKEVVIDENKSPEDYKGTIDLWSFTDELKSAGIIEEFNKVYPNIEVKLTVVPMEDNAYSTKLASVLGNGVGAPDVFTSEVAFVKRFSNLDYYEDLSQEPYNAEELTSNMVEYTVDLGRNNEDNSIRALTWQACPGGIFYKKSLAKKYLGTDDPAEISKMVSTMEGLIELGETIKEKSNGEAVLFPGYGELSNVARGSREQPWVVDNKLVIDDKMMQYMDDAKVIRDKGLDAKATQWSPEWSGAMADDKTFAFLLPTWGLNYTIAGNAPDTKGDWGLATAPTPYYWGGTWIGMYKNSEKKDLAWQFVKFITSNDEYLETYGKKSGDFINNINVIEKFAACDDGNSEFLGGQNSYAMYKEMIPYINGKLVTDYDETINSKWDNAMDLYITGEMSKDEALEFFKSEVQSAYPEIEVE